MQGFAGVFVVTVLPTEPMWTGFSFLQVCGKTDLFRPQVRWGDNCARRVERQSPGGGFPNSGISCVIAAYVGTGLRRHRSVICIRADRGDQSGGDVG